MHGSLGPLRQDEAGHARRQRGGGIYLGTVADVDSSIWWNAQPFGDQEQSARIGLKCSDAW